MSPRQTKLTILFSGMVAGVPDQGGAAWAVLQYLLGLRQLGHQVYFVESVNPEELRPQSVPLEQSRNAAYFRSVMREFEFSNQSALLLAGTHQTVGIPHAELVRVAQRADLLINIAGRLTDEQIIERIPVRAYLDLDPAFVQLWHSQGIDMRFRGHTHFVTVGQAIGTDGCDIPDCGHAWIPTLPPVVLSHWPASPPPSAAAPITTVANWRGYGSIEHRGVQYGQKAHSFRKLIDLPQRCTGENFHVALSIHPDETRDLQALRDNHWHLSNPTDVAATPDRYRSFISASRAELGIAKSGYVTSRCGWFSDRSVCYLASGRPVIAQDAGFSRFIPVGDGLFAFNSTDEAQASIESMRRDYGRHSRAARTLAEQCFDSDRVLARLLNRLGFE